MKVIAEPLPGAKLIEPRVFVDQRGDFVKTYHAGMFAELGIPFTPAEEFYSTSHAGVVRGMHFQLPPHDHAKLVYCVRGRVMDVLLDLRKALPSYGQAVATELSRSNSRIFYIPSGVAHGFLALEDDSVMVYKTATVHSATHDAGIHWDSFGFKWGVDKPVISMRDSALPTLAVFASPF